MCVRVPVSLLCILFDCVCNLRQTPSVAPCVTVSSLRMSDSDSSVCQGGSACVPVTFCGRMCVKYYHIPSDLCISGCDFGVCVHVSGSPSVQTAVLLPG